MQLYLRKKLDMSIVTVIDTYESLIWSDRYYGWGDFELHIPVGITPKELNIGMFLTNDLSDRVMWIDTIERPIRDSDSGSHKYIISGRSFEYITSLRSTLTTDLTGRTVSEVMVNLAQRYLIAGTYNATTYGLPSTFVRNVVTNDEPVNYPGITTMSLDKALMEYGLQIDASFKLTPSTTVNNYWDFVIYNGEDRSSTVIFSSESETLLNTRSLYSNHDYRNVALVTYDRYGSYLQVIEPRYNQSLSWHNTRVVSVDSADTVAPSGGNQTIQDIARSKGLEAILDRKQASHVDGEVGQLSKFKYGTDYHMGDIVGIIDYLGKEVLKKRVTEYIWSVDSTGITEYPTLSDP